MAARLEFWGLPARIFVHVQRNLREARDFTGAWKAKTAIRLYEDQYDWMYKEKVCFRILKPGELTMCTSEAPPVPTRPQTFEDKMDEHGPNIWLGCFEPYAGWVQCSDNGMSDRTLCYSACIQYE